MRIFHISALVVVCSAAFAGCGDRSATDRRNSDLAAAPAPLPSPTSTPRPSPPKRFKIRVDDARYEGGRVVVAGSTDLPDGAAVIVNFDVLKGMSDDYVGSDERVVVSNGKFASTLLPKDAFPKSKPQVIEVMFTPRGQDPQIVAITGKNGENLGGENVRIVSGVNVIEVVHRVKLPIK